MTTTVEDKSRTKKKNTGGGARAKVWVVRRLKEIEVKLSQLSFGGTLSLNFLVGSTLRNVYTLPLFRFLVCLSFLGECTEVGIFPPFFSKGSYPPYLLFTLRKEFGWDSCTNLKCHVQVEISLLETCRSSGLESKVVRREWHGIGHCSHLRAHVYTCHRLKCFTHLYREVPVSNGKQIPT